MAASEGHPSAEEINSLIGQTNALGASDAHPTAQEINSLLSQRQAHGTDVITQPQPGGPILKPVENTRHDLAEIAKGIGGTIERWAKAAWEGIKHAWHYTQEHGPSIFSLHHLSAGWIGLIAGAGVFGIAKGADSWRKRRARKKEEAQGH